MGDGALVEFAQRRVRGQLRAARSSRPPRPSRCAPGAERIRYRIGINLGEVIVEGDDIYGDGVNVAARLQALAEPGGIALSRTVRDQVAGKVAGRVRGPRRAHGQEHRAAGARVRPARPPAPQTPGAPSPRERQRLSICVLPFANMSGDPEQEYFSDGITEDIITDLSKVSALAVVSRNTAFTFKGKHVDIAQVARQLKVSHVLEGSVRKAGNRVRITAQLIEGATDSHLWAERYDRDLNDIFALQDEISEAIVKALKLQLLPAEKKAIEQRSTTNPEAYKLYLMARQYNATGNSRHREITVRLCQRAVEIDPELRPRVGAAGDLANRTCAWCTSTTGDTGWEAGGARAGAGARSRRSACGQGTHPRRRGPLRRGAGRSTRSALRLDPDAYEVNAAAARCFIGMQRYDGGHRVPRDAPPPPSRRISGRWAWPCSATRPRATSTARSRRARRNLERVEKVIVAEPDHGLAMGWGVSALVALRRSRTRQGMGRARDAARPRQHRTCSYNLACTMVTLGEFDTAIELLAPDLRARAAAEPALVRRPTRPSIRSAATRASRRCSRRRKRGSRQTE